MYCARSLLCVYTAHEKISCQLQVGVRTLCSLGLNLHTEVDFCDFLYLLTTFRILRDTIR